MMSAVCVNYFYYFCMQNQRNRIMERHYCLDDSPTFRMLELGEVDSTNNFLRRMNTPGDNRTTLVTAEYQTAGRGSGQNSWESARGRNLLLSLRVMPDGLAARRMYAVSEAAALAVADALEVFTPGFLVKWPNDVYHNSRKVAGILIENDLLGATVQRSTIGIGININQREFLSNAPNPISLAQIVGHDVERRFVLEQFMEHMTRNMTQINRGDLDALHARYLDRLYLRDEEHDYTDSDGAFRAAIVDVEPAGHLILRDAEGKLRRYGFKEVRF